MTDIESVFALLVAVAVLIYLVTVLLRTDKGA